MFLVGGKAYKSYHTILNLCEIAYTEDAGVILRSLFQLLVITRWLSLGNSEHKAQKYLGWFWVAMNKELDRYGSRIALGLARMVRRHYKDHNVLFEYRDTRGKLKMSKKWYEPDVKTLEQMATDVELKSHYDGLYKPLSSVEHSDALSYFAMISDVKRNKGAASVSLHSDLFVPAYLRNAFQYYGEILQTWNRTFSVLDEVKLEKLLREGIEFFSRDMGASQSIVSDNHAQHGRESASPTACGSLLAPTVH
jgi:hypothetical protein